MTPINEYRAIALREPHPIAFTGNDDLGIWEFDDELIVIRIGPSDGIAAETIAVDPHLLGPLARTLMAVVKRREGR